MMSASSGDQRSGGTGLRRPRRGYVIDESDEPFNELYREGGGYPRDEGWDYDLVHSFSFLEHNVNALRGELRSMGAEFEDGRACLTHSGGVWYPSAMPRSASDAIQFRLWDAKIWATVWAGDCERNVILLVNTAIDGLRAARELAPISVKWKIFGEHFGTPKKIVLDAALSEIAKEPTPARSLAVLSDWI